MLLIVENHRKRASMRSCQEDGIVGIVQRDVTMCTGYSNESSL